MSRSQPPRVFSPPRRKAPALPDSQESATFFRGQESTPTVQKPAVDVDAVLRKYRPLSAEIQGTSSAVTFGTSAILSKETFTLRPPSYTTVRRGEIDTPTAPVRSEERTGTPKAFRPIEVKSALLQHSFFADSFSRPTGSVFEISTHPSLRETQRNPSPFDAVTARPSATHQASTLSAGEEVDTFSKLTTRVRLGTDGLSTGEFKRGTDFNNKTKSAGMYNGDRFGQRGRSDLDRPWQFGAQEQYEHDVVINRETHAQGEVTSRLAMYDQALTNTRFNREGLFNTPYDGNAGPPDLRGSGGVSRSRTDHALSELKNLTATRGTAGGAAPSGNIGSSRVAKAPLPYDEILREPAAVREAIARYSTDLEPAFLNIEDSVLPTSLEYRHAVRSPQTKKEYDMAAPYPARSTSPMLARYASPLPNDSISRSSPTRFSPPKRETSRGNPSPDDLRAKLAQAQERVKQDRREANDAAVASAAAATGAALASITGPRPGTATTNTREDWSSVQSPSANVMKKLEEARKGYEELNQRINSRSIGLAEGRGSPVRNIRSSLSPRRSVSASPPRLNSSSPDYSRQPVRIENSIRSIFDEPRDLSPVRGRLVNREFDKEMLERDAVVNTILGTLPTPSVKARKNLNKTNPGSSGHELRADDDLYSYLKSLSNKVPKIPKTLSRGTRGLSSSKTSPAAATHTRVGRDLGIDGHSRSPRFTRSLSPSSKELDAILQDTEPRPDLDDPEETGVQELDQLKRRWKAFQAEDEEWIDHIDGVDKFKEYLSEEQSPRFFNSGHNQKMTPPPSADRARRGSTPSQDRRTPIATPGVALSDPRRQSIASLQNRLSQPSDITYTDFDPENPQDVKQHVHRIEERLNEINDLRELESTEESMLKDDLEKSKMFLEGRSSLVNTSMYRLRINVMEARKINQPDCSVVLSLNRIRFETGIPVAGTQSDPKWNKKTLFELANPKKDIVHLAVYGNGGQGLFVGECEIETSADFAGKETNEWFHLVKDNRSNGMIRLSLLLRAPEQNPAMNVPLTASMGDVNVANSAALPPKSPTPTAGSPGMVRRGSGPSLRDRTPSPSGRKTPQSPPSPSGSARSDSTAFGVDKVKVAVRLVRAEMKQAQEWYAVLKYHNKNILKTNHKGRSTTPVINQEVVADFHEKSVLRFEMWDAERGLIKDKLKGSHNFPMRGIVFNEEEMSQWIEIFDDKGKMVGRVFAEFTVHNGSFLEAKDTIDRSISPGALSAAEGYRKHTPTSISVDESARQQVAMRGRTPTPTRRSPSPAMAVTATTIHDPSTSSAYMSPPQSTAYAPAPATSASVQRRASAESVKAEYATPTDSNKLSFDQLFGTPTQENQTRQRSGSAVSNGSGGRGRSPSPGRPPSGSYGEGAKISVANAATSPTAVVEYSNTATSPLANEGAYAETATSPMSPEQKAPVPTHAPAELHHHEMLLRQQSAILERQAEMLSTQQEEIAKLRRSSTAPGNLDDGFDNAFSGFITPPSANRPSSPAERIPTQREAIAAATAMPAKQSFSDWDPTSPTFDFDAALNFEGNKDQAQAGPSTVGERSSDVDMHMAIQQGLQEKFLRGRQASEPFVDPQELEGVIRVTRGSSAARHASNLSADEAAALAQYQQAQLPPHPDQYRRQSTPGISPSQQSPRMTPPRRASSRTPPLSEATMRKLGGGGGGRATLSRQSSASSLASKASTSSKKVMGELKKQLSKGVSQLKPKKSSKR